MRAEEELEEEEEGKVKKILKEFRKKSNSPELFPKTCQRDNERSTVFHGILPTTLVTSRVYLGSVFSLSW